MADKTSSDDERGGLGLLLGLGAALAVAAGYAGYKLGGARAALGPPCDDCLQKAERARQAADAEAQAYADLQAAGAEAEAATILANGAGPADVNAGAPGASLG